MNTTKIFQNSWSLMLRYRALWIFGVILALTTISLGSAVWARNDQQQDPDRMLIDWQLDAQDRAWIRENFGFDLPARYRLTTEDLRLRLNERLDDPALSGRERLDLVLRILAIGLAVILALFALNRVLRYTSETALIRMVNDQQYKQQAHSVRQGWRLGFSLAAFKLFLIDLLVYSLLFLISCLIFLPATLPVLIAISGTPAGISLGILLMITLLLVSAAALIVLWIAALITLQLAYRACCLEGLDVFASIWRGFRLMRRQLSGVGLTGLVIAGLDLAYPLLMVPVFLLLAATGLLVGGLLALALGGLLGLVLTKVTAWTIALIVGAALLGLVVGAPLAWLGGLREIFKSCAWTLTFREAASQPVAERAPAPQPALPEASAA